MATSIVAQKKSGFPIVFGLLVGVGAIQVIMLIGQFNSDLLASDVFLIYGPVYILVMSLGLITLILIEINNLSEFHIDKFTIITFLLGSLVGVMAELTGQVCSPVIGVANIVIIFILLRRKPNIPRTDFRWTLLGIVLGSITVILLAIVEVYVRPGWHPSTLLQKPNAGTAVGVIFRQFSTVSLEELLFRGFLWGYLRQYGWKESKIIWLQGLLFWLLHFGRLFMHPFTFFVAIPIGTLISSKLTAYSKQIYPSLLAHTIINAVSTVFNLATF